MSTDYYSREATNWPAGIYPRYSPNYQSYQKKITLERVDDDNAPGYAGYSGRTNYHPYFFRDSTNGPSYPPFGYISSFKTPVRPALPAILPTPTDTNLKAFGNNTLERNITTTEAVVVKPFRKGIYRILGYLLSILAIMTFVFEIADVIVATLSDTGYCNVRSGFLKIPWFFAWVVPGIWASIPIFFTGILAIYVTDNYGRVFRALAIVCSVSAFFFAPAIIAVSAAEEATFNDCFPYVFGNISAKDPMIPDPIKAKLVLPIILIILGILEMLLLLYLTILLCQAYEGFTSEVILTERENSTEAIPEFVVPKPMPFPVPVPVPAPAPPQPTNPGLISILVPRPAETLPSPRVTGVGVPGRVVYMEAHNRGYAYANVPGYFSTQPSGTAAATTGTGYRWF